MSDDNVIPVFYDDAGDAAAARRALREAYEGRTRVILARLRREVANDNRAPRHG